MFPNARLMAVAILAAIAGIGCGLGLFATFRVNHEPLTRLAEGSPPLQLGLALGSDARVPLEARLQFGTAAKLISVPVVVPTPDTAEQTGAEAALVPDSTVQNPIPDPVVQEPAADSALAEPADADAADQSNNVTVAVAAVPAEAPSAAPEPEATAPKAIAPEATAPEATAPAQQEAVAPAQDQQLSEPVAPTQGAVQTAATSTAADAQQPKAKAPKPEAKKTGKPARASRPAQARHPTKIVRARRPAVIAAAQTTSQYPQPTYSQAAYAQPVYSQPTYSQPTYTWADGTVQASQPVRRVVVRGRRAVQKTAPAVQSNPAAATAGLSNGQ
jgi:hypothetical protein